MQSNSEARESHRTKITGGTYVLRWSRINGAINFVQASESCLGEAISFGT
jgi:hypothetical protein